MAAGIDCEVTLQGSFLDSVGRSEISVTVGGEPCTERQAAEDDVNTVRFLYSCSFMYLFKYMYPLLQYVCTPPDDAPGGNTEAPVVVNESTNFLQFIVLLQLFPITGTSGNQP